MGEYKRAKFEAFENAVPPSPILYLAHPYPLVPLLSGPFWRALGPSIRKTADSDFFQSLSSNLVPPSQCYGPTFVKSEGPSIPRPLSPPLRCNCQQNPAVMESFDHIQLELV